MRFGTLVTATLMIMLSCPALAACPAGMEPRTRIELYFGRNSGETVGVSEEAWAAFLDTEITPRFPDGLSVIDIAGQWKDPASGRIVREPGKLLVLIVHDGDAARPKLAGIVARYKDRHSQQSVLTTEAPVCVPK